MIATQAATSSTSPAEAEPGAVEVRPIETAADKVAKAAEAAKTTAKATAEKAAAEAKAKAPAAAAPPPTAPAAQSTQAASRGIRGQALFTYKPDEWASRPRAIYDYQVARWLGGWSSNVTGEVNTIVSQSAGQLALLVAYNIPGRDCGSYSAGGAGGSAAYRSWIQAFASGIGNRKAIVILEPDALAQLDCLDAGGQAARLADLSYAVDILKNQTQAAVYIDAGNSGWIASATMANSLKQANIAGSNGFALNVSNFKSTGDSINYGEQVVNALSGLGVNGARYVVDTSRNGQGPASGNLAWCNPPGRGLGKRPTTNPDAGAHNDAYLWVKTIGESDGECNGGPPAGQFYEAYAQELIANAVH